MHESMQGEDAALPPKLEVDMAKWPEPGPSMALYPLLRGPNDRAGSFASGRLDVM